MSIVRFEAGLVGDPNEIAALLGALAPEHESEMPGVRAHLSQVAPGEAHLALEADVVPQLRAALNAYLRWMRAVEDVLRVAPPPSKEAP